MALGRKKAKKCSRGHNFSKTRKIHPNGDTYCSACKKIRYDKFRKNNPQKINEYYHKCRLKKLYGINIDQYKALYIKQDKKCAICKCFLDFKNKKTHVDHCHKTKKVRGLLCHHCNTAIGLFKDNINIIKKAIKYLNSGKSNKK